MGAMSMSCISLVVLLTAVAFTLFGGRFEFVKLRLLLLLAATMQQCCILHFYFHFAAAIRSSNSMFLYHAYR